MVCFFFTTKLECVGLGFLDSSFFTISSFSVVAQPVPRLHIRIQKLSCRMDDRSRDIITILTLLIRSMEILLA